MCRKEEISNPPKGGCFSKRMTIKPWYEKGGSNTTTYSSIPIGWILRLERRGCRFESCLLYIVCSSNRSGRKIFILVIRVRVPYRLLLDGAMVAFQNLTLKMLVRIQLQYHLLALAYLVKRHIVAVENRVRSPKSTLKAYSSMDENTSLRMKRYRFESC